MLANVDQRLSWPRPMGVGTKGTIASATAYGGGKAFNDLFGAILKSDERSNKTDQILPWQLTYSEDTLANMVVLLKDLKSQMRDAYTSKLVSAKYKKHIKKIRRKIDKVKRMVFDIAEDIGKMKV